MHTPGPWKIHQYQRCADVINYMVFVERHETAAVCENPDICNVYAIGDDGRENGETNANARLIAAAPDLLDALSYALLHIEHREGLKHRLDLFTTDERNYLRNAIAKATGGNQ